MSTRRTTKRPFLVLLGIALILALVPGAAAHEADAFEHGRLFLSFDNSGEDCAVTVEGRHVDAEHGTLQFWMAPDGPSEPRVVLEEDIDGEPEADGEGWRFEAGPFDDFGFDEPDWVIFAFEQDGQEHEDGKILEYDACRNFDLVTAFGPETGGEPGCTFMIEGENLVSPEGFVQVRDSDQNEVRRIDVEPNPEDQGAGWEFVVGPVTLEKDDRYNVRFVYTGNDTTHRSTISDSFLLEGCGEDRVAPAFCSFAQQAFPQEDGSILLQWITPQFGEGTNIYRATGDGEFEPIDQIETEPSSAQRYVDETTEPGVTYRYMLVAFNDAGEAERECEVLEVTAIPFFGAPMVGALAAIGAVGAYAWAGRGRNA